METNKDKWQDLNDPDEYLVSSHYQVWFFNLWTGLGHAWLERDMHFRNIKGIKEEMETEEINAGGVNTEKISVPKKVTHGNIVFERGILPLKWASPLDVHFTEAMTYFQFVPTNVVIVLASYKNRLDGELTGKWVKKGIHDESGDWSSRTSTSKSFSKITNAPKGRKPSQTPDYFDWEWKETPTKTKGYDGVAGAWLVRNAYPVKWALWDFGPFFNDYTGELYKTMRAVETLELAYSHIHRLM